VAGACLCWALDNNLTRKISAGTRSRSRRQGSGSRNGESLRGGGLWSGFAGTGDRRRRCSGRPARLWSKPCSFRGRLAAARHRADRRLFFDRPFHRGSRVFCIAWRGPDASFWIAAVLMAVGVALHLTERHRHMHRHEALTHTHPTLMTSITAMNTILRGTATSRTRILTRMIASATAMRTFRTSIIGTVTDGLRALAIASFATAACAAPTCPRRRNRPRAIAREAGRSDRSRVAPIACRAHRQPRKRETAVRLAERYFELATRKGPRT